MSNTITSDEVNYLVFRYLQESGFVHSSFTFGYESHIIKSNIDGSQIPPGALLSYLQRGLSYVEIESTLQQQQLKQPDTNNPNSAAPNDVYDNSSSLLEVHRTLSQASRQVNDDVMATKNLVERTHPNAKVLIPNTSEKNSRNDDDLISINRSAKNSKENGPSIDNNSNNNYMEDGDKATDMMVDSGNKAKDKDSLKTLGEKQVLILKGHTSEVFSCSWSKSAAASDLLASGSGDSTARLWRVPAGGVSQSLSTEVTSIVLNHLSPQPGAGANAPPVNHDVTAMEWHPFEPLLATGDYHGHVRIWDGSGNVVQTYRRHHGPIFSIRWNKNGNIILSGSADKHCVVWDYSLNQFKQQYAVHSQALLDVDWQDETSFASCSVDKMIYVCKLDEKEPTSQFQGHYDEINAIRWDPSGTLLASCSDDCTAKIWSPNFPKPISNLTDHHKEVYSVRWSPNTSTKSLVLATGSFDGTAKLWDVNSGKCLNSLEKHYDPIYSLEFSPSGEFLATGSFDRHVHVWNVKDGSLVKSYYGGDKGGIFEVSWNSTGDKVAAAFSNNTVVVIDMKV